MSGHAKFSPSQLHRLLACPASYRESLPHGKEDTPSVYAEEGTMLHTQAEKLFLDPSYPLDEYLTEEQATTVEDAVDYVNSTLKAIGWPSPDVFVETEMKVSPERWGLLDAYGTADVLAYNSKTNLLIVLDYKFGAGVFVDVVNNPQFMAYGAGGLARFPEAKLVSLHVDQPRLNNYDHVDIPAPELKTWCKETNEKLKRCSIVPAQYNPGSDICRWCSARFTCAARIDWLQSITDDVIKFAKSKTNVPLERLVALHNEGAAIKKAINEISAYLLAKAVSGEKIPSLKLVHGKATRYWKDPARVEMALEAMLGDNAFTPRKLISPAQLEKIDKSFKKDESILKLWDKKLSYKLVDVNNRAKEVPPPHPSNEEFAGFED